MNFITRAVTSLASLALIVVLLGTSIFVTQKFMPQPPVAQIVVVSSTPHELGVDVIKTIMDLLEKSYIHPVTDRELATGAVKTLKLYLKAQKFDPSKIPDLPESAQDRPAMVAAIKEDIDQAAHVVDHKLTDEKLLYASLAGMTMALDDPYCQVFPPHEFKRFEEAMNGGNFGGIGTYLELDHEHQNRLIVTEPIEGTPAYEAGIKEGDYIAKIDGKDTAGLDIESAANKIRGPQGSTVTLTIVHTNETRPIEIPVKRALIHVRSVSSKIVNGNIGYIRLRVFGEDTDTEFDEELAKVIKKGSKGLILDLRNNGGGYVTAALEVCSHFLKKGQRIVSVVNPRTGRNDPHECLGGKEVVTLPLVLLVNRYSASASEITAGCLKDQHVAKLVGEKTFGKGSVQQLQPLGDGGAIKYTIAHYLTPDGRDIHKKGIPADIEVKLTPQDKQDRALSVAEKTVGDEITAGGADAKKL